jgi:hypothetical protein
LQSPLAYLFVALIISPLWLLSLSAKAHSFNEHWKALTRKGIIWDVDDAVEKYLKMLKRKSGKRS